LIREDPCTETLASHVIRCKTPIKRIGLGRPLLEVNVQNLPCITIPLRQGRVLLSIALVGHHVIHAKSPWQVSQTRGKRVAGSISTPWTGQAVTQAPQESQRPASIRTQPSHLRAPVGQAETHSWSLQATHTRMEGFSGQSASTMILDRFGLISFQWVQEQICMQIWHSVHRDDRILIMTSSQASVPMPNA